MRAACSVPDALGRDRPGRPSRSATMSRSWTATSPSPSPCPGSSSHGAYGPGPVTKPVAGERAERAELPARRRARWRRTYSGQNRRTWPTISVTPASAPRRSSGRQSASRSRHRLLAEDVLPRPRRRDRQLRSGGRSAGTRRRRRSPGASAASSDVGAPRRSSARRAARARSTSASTTSRSTARDARPRLGVDPACEACTDDGDLHSHSLREMSRGTRLRHLSSVPKNACLDMSGGVAARRRGAAERLGHARMWCGPAPQQTPR